MRMGQGVRAGLGHGGITCVLQTQFSSFSCFSTHIMIDQINIAVLYSSIDIFY